jgi:hypothetical protein
MGKKRVQVRQGRRQQVRQIKPKIQPPAQDSAAQKKQRERYVSSGGMLQGYAPELVIRIGYYAAAGAVACLLVMALILLFLPYGWPVRIAAAVPWLVPIVLGASFIAPAFRLARQDRKKEPRLVQGTLIGASTVSQQLGLGMLYVRTRGGDEQFLVAPERLAKVPGNQVTVMVNVTPALRHVRSVAVVGQRLVPRPDQPVPDVIRRVRLLPIVTPVALAAGVIVGDDAVALAPIHGDILHAVLAVVIGALLGAAVYGASMLLQRRLSAQMQELVQASS